MPRRYAPEPLADEPAGHVATPPGRRERAKQEKRGRLVAAARELFSSKGFAAATTSEIAQRADVGAGTLFLYVQSKEELLVLVFQQDMGRVCDEAFATLPARATLLDEIVHVYAAMSAFHDRDRALARVFAKEMAFVRGPNRAALLAFLDGLFTRTDARIEAAKARGEVAADVPARMLSENLFATFFISLQHALGGDVSTASPEHVGALRARLALQLRGAVAGRTTTPARPAPPAARAAGGRRGGAA